METRIRFIQDSDPMSPREWENLGHMVCWHRRYLLGDEQLKCDPKEWREAFDAENPDSVILPLYLYDHSGITMSVGAFSCPWDSGQVGWIYATPADAKRIGFEEWNADSITTALETEVSVYDQYLTGDIFWYCIQQGEKCDHGDIHWETIDSCGGFFGSLEESGALDNIGDEYAELARTQWDTVGVECT